jgi:starch phosphorylase
MTVFKTFKVVPDIPEKLSPLYDLAYNLWLSWNPEAVKLYIRMDGNLWQRVRGNPVKMLMEVDQARLDELAGDEGYVVEVQRVYKKFMDYLSAPKPGQEGKESRIAYFSMEYGLIESLPIYSGGLGVLSGDHIKSASDLNLNLIGVGLLYRNGYFQQYLNQDGWQQEFYNTYDFHNMGVQEVKGEDGGGLEIEMALANRKIYLKAWKLEVGRIPIFLLDANIPQNSEAERKLTAQLYGGDREMRLQQEILLGIGGVRLCEKLGLPPSVLHMNEGHSAFAAFERARQLMEKHSLVFAEAIEVSRKSGVFTTHTPVPAGNDVFDSGLMYKYFENYARELGISIEDFLKFGRVQQDNLQEPFSMTVAAIRNSTYINGVSRLHGQVSRKMWRNIWPPIPQEHIPIKTITNGVHVATWVSFEMAELLERYFGANWQVKQDQPKLWQKIESIPDPELWNVHEYCRRKLVRFVRERLQTQLMNKGASRLLIDEAREALNPEALTIGFARRFATYKRGNLILKDPERLLRIINNPERPVQLVFAGKAHPQDQEGKKVIEGIIHFINANRLIKKVIFIENYDIQVGRCLLQGVDVWLNNPLRPLEACGTSGMKAAANGVLNLSVLDGWWDEAYDHTSGWAIGSGEEYRDRHYQDEVESKAIYSILENDIVPLFYRRDSYGLPREWIKIMKRAFVSITSVYNTQRMVKDYDQQFYQKAARYYRSLSQDEFNRAQDFIQWQNQVKKDFNNIRIKQVVYDEQQQYKINDRIRVEVHVFLGKIKPEDVNVGAYYGNLVGDNQLKESEVESLPEVKEAGNGEYVFSGHLVCKKTGDFGFKIRITPHHPLMVDPYEMNLALWD